MTRTAIAAALLALARVASAQPVPDEPEISPPVAPTPAVAEPEKPAPPASDDVQQQLDDLYAKLDAVRSQANATQEQIKTLAPANYISAWVDVGAFAVQGNGAGTRSDINHVYFPYYARHVPGVWTFMGDPLATMINADGEPADSGLSREDPNDQLHSGGRPTMIVNSLGLAIGRSIDHGVSLKSLVELLPRPDHDVLDIELAEIEYRPTADWAHPYDIVLSAGKIESVLGIEYRAQDAPNRIEVTPSLLWRYTSARNVGVSARLNQGHARSVSLAVTDGDNFEPSIELNTALLDAMLHARSGAALYLQWIFPFGAEGLELGISGAYGRQDGQTSDKAHQWHYGFDAHLRSFHGVDVTAEYVQGRQRGSDNRAAAPCERRRAPELQGPERT